MELFILICIFGPIVGIGLIPATIASRKGGDFLGWWIFGSALFIVALPCALLKRADSAALERIALADGGRKCPRCAEIVKGAAEVCRFCQYEFYPPEETTLDPAEKTTFEPPEGPALWPEARAFYAQPAHAAPPSKAVKIILWTLVCWIVLVFSVAGIIFAGHISTSN
jgi:hypothetical protein